MIKNILFLSRQQVGIKTKNEKKGWNSHVHARYTHLFHAVHDMDTLCIGFYAIDIHGLILKVDILLIPHHAPMVVQQVAVVEIPTNHWILRQEISHLAMYISDEDEFTDNPHQIVPIEDAFALP